MTLTLLGIIAFGAVWGWLLAPVAAFRRPGAQQLAVMLAALAPIAVLPGDAGRLALPALLVSTLIFASIHWTWRAALRSARGGRGGTRNG